MVKNGNRKNKNKNRKEKRNTITAAFRKPTVSLIFKHHHTHNICEICVFGGLGFFVSVFVFVAGSPWNGRAVVGSVCQSVMLDLRGSLSFTLAEGPGYKTLRSGNPQLSWLHWCHWRNSGAVSPRLYCVCGPRYGSLVHVVGAAMETCCAGCPVLDCLAWEGQELCFQNWDLHAFWGIGKGHSTVVARPSQAALTGGEADAMHPATSATATKLCHQLTKRHLAAPCCFSPTSLRMQKTLCIWNHMILPPAKHYRDANPSWGPWSKLAS